jgi:hypothetical protein
MKSQVCNAPLLPSGLESSHSYETVSDQEKTESDHADQQTRLLLSWAMVLQGSISVEESSRW